ncbi:MAG: efflux RND transporter periplasmic adaptor subunit [Chlorobium sp.]|jgi:RND family efflux transporter MFP subunit|nr:efflux RND transporter periplasmic adaptor subunit [Chlorobium sp.]
MSIGSNGIPMRKPTTIPALVISFLLLVSSLAALTPAGASTASLAKNEQQQGVDTLSTLQKSAANIEKELGLAEASPAGAQPGKSVPNAPGITGVSGFTEAKSDIHLGLTEAGRIARIMVQEGDRVKAGAVLLNLDNTLEELEVKHRQLKRDTKAELNFSMQRQSLSGEKFHSAKRLLEAKTAISRDEFDQAKIDHAQAVADVARFKSQEELEAIEYGLAAEQLRRRTLSAPVSGIVVHLAKAEGEIVQANEPLVRLVEATTGRFVGNADFAVGKQLTVRQPVCIRIELPGETVNRPAVVSFLSPVIDTASNLMEVKAEFANTEQPVQLGGAALLVPAACP